MFIIIKKKKKEKLRSGKSQLLSEYQLYKSITPHVGFPAVHWCGCEGNYQMMAMQLLGPNLSELLCFCGNRFGLKTILMLADQMVFVGELYFSFNCVIC